MKCPEGRQLSPSRIDALGVSTQGESGRTDHASTRPAHGRLCRLSTALEAGVLTRRRSGVREPPRPPSLFSHLSRVLAAAGRGRVLRGGRVIGFPTGGCPWVSGSGRDRLAGCRVGRTVE